MKVQQILVVFVQILQSEVDKENSQALEQVAQKIHIQNYDEAIEICDQVIRNSPKEANAYYLKGFALMHMGNFVEANEAFDLNIKYHRTSPEAHFQKAIALRNLQKQEESIDEFEKCIEQITLEDDEKQAEMKILHAQAFHGKGLTYFLMDRQDQSIKSFDTSLEIDPQNQIAQQQRGYAQYKLANRQKDTNQHTSLSQNMQFEKSLASFKTFLEHAEEDSKDIENVNFMIGNCQIQMKQWQTSFEYLEKVIEQNEQNHQALKNQAVALYQYHSDSNREEWDDHGNKMNKPHNKNTDILIKAVKTYQKVLKIHPEDDLSWKDKGMILLELGQWKPALNAFDHALLQATEHVDYLYQHKGLAFMQLEKKIAAIYFLILCTVKNEEHQQAFFTVGKVYMELKKQRSAIKFINKGLENNDEHEEAWANLAKCYMKLKKWRHARDAQEQCQEINMRSPECRKGLKEVKKKLGEDDDEDEEALPTEPQYDDDYNRGPDDL